MNNIVEMAVDTVVVVSFLTVYGAFTAYYAPDIINDVGAGWEVIYTVMILVIAVSVPLFIVGVLPSHNYEVDHD